MGKESVVDIQGVNNTATLNLQSDEFGEQRRESLSEAREALSDRVDELSNEWQQLGLSEREAQTIAYRELGLNNRAIAYFLELSPSTVSEYVARATEKYEQAKTLVHRMESPEVVDPLEKYWVCPECQHRSQKSKGEFRLEVDSGHSEMTCYNCWNTLIVNGQID